MERASFFAKKYDIKVKNSAFFELVGGQVESGSRVEIIKKVMISKKVLQRRSKKFHAFKDLRRFDEKRQKIKA